MSVAKILRFIVLSFVAMAVAACAAWYGYKAFDQEIHVIVESSQFLKDIRQYVRMWPPPKDYLACELIEPSPTPRFEAPVAVVDDRLFVFGGFNDTSLHATTRCDVFDPVDRTWTELTPLPAKVTHVGVALVGDEVWLAGGFAGDHPGPAVGDVWIYDIPSDTWSAGPALPEKRAAGGLVYLDGTLHFFGGTLIDRRTDSADHWTLDLENGESWVRAPDLPTARNHLSAATLGGQIYAIGGQIHHDGSGLDMDNVDVYNPASGVWRSVAPLPTRRAHTEPGTFVWRDQICVSGGERGYAEALYDIDCYHPASDAWHRVPALPEPLRAPVVRPLGDVWFVGLGGAMPNGMIPVADSRLCQEPANPAR